MAYQNPLHTPISGVQVSSYSSLSGAVPQITYKFISPFRRLLPQQSYVPSAKPTNVTVKVPHTVVPFDYIGHTGQGVPMSELGARTPAALATIIQGAGDQVLAHTGTATITFRIHWPGYEAVEWSRSIDTSGITRAKLGATIAMNFGRYLEAVRKERSNQPLWKVGTTDIRFEHLILLSVRTVADNCWQAEVAIDRPM